MNVLGIHSHGHDAGAALACGGRAFSISLERITRMKHDGRFPAAAIRYVMEQAGIGLGEVDLVVSDSLGFNTSDVRRALKKTGCRAPVEFISHHEAHAASAYFTGPFREAAVLIIDAAGSYAGEMPGPRPPLAAHERSRELQSTYAGRDGRLTTVLKTFSAPGRAVGPGTPYGVGAMMAGYPDLEGGKLMALAALGERGGLFPDCRFEDFEGHFLAPGDPERDPLNPENIGYYSRLLFRGVPPRRAGEPVIQAQCEIARAVQEASAAAALEIALRLHSATGCRNLCVAGGFGLNCPANSACLSSTPFSKIYVHPAANDSGIPLGAALYGRHEIAREPFRPMRFSPFLGKQYSPAVVKSELDLRPGIIYSRPRDFFRRAAELLAEGKLCGWFHGGSEHGPRALGNRSILAHPALPGVKERLNETVKLRESFRPYAPAVLAEKCGKYFRFKGESPHMLLLAEARPRWREKLAPVLHVDGTARLQTVSRRDNPALRRLLEEFELLTGLPLLLNTSFNRRGEPLVETPGDAVECFLGTGLDFLAIQGFIASGKPEGALAERQPAGKP